MNKDNMKKCRELLSQRECLKRKLSYLSGRSGMHVMVGAGSSSQDVWSTNGRCENHKGEVGEDSPLEDVILIMVEKELNNKLSELNASLESIGYELTEGE